MIEKRMFLAVVVVALAVGGLAACGGSGSGETVAQVGGTPITRAEVAHWMSTLAGGDYYEVSHAHTLPVGLVSDPPDYAACVSRLRAASVAGAQGSSTSAELLRKCRELNLALRIQAASYLVRAQWLTSVYREEGVTATEQDVRQLFKQVRAAQYPTEADLHQYLTNTRSSLADFLFVLKLDVLYRKAASKVAAGGKRAAAEFVDAERRWTAKTSCSAGYVVPYCKQFKGQPSYPGSLSPAILAEQLTALVTGLCVNRQACAK